MDSQIEESFPWHYRSIRATISLATSAGVGAEVLTDGTQAVAVLPDNSPARGLHTSAT